MSKWLEFGDVIMKKINIDYFEKSDYKILCNHHQGLNYMEACEYFKEKEDALKRYNELQLLLELPIIVKGKIEEK